jgi:hypothetical protein
MRNPEKTIDTQRLGFISSIDENDFPNTRAMPAPGKREGVKTFYRRLFSGLLFLFFGGAVLSSEENHEMAVQLYMESLNQTYPIHIDGSLEKSFYRDWSLAGDTSDGFYVSIDEPRNDFDLPLTSEQKYELENFITIFQLDTQYIDELIRMSKTNTFAIKNIIMEHYDWRKDSIVVSIMFYADYKIGESWVLNSEKNIWIAYNMAYYSFSNNVIEFSGWGL